MSSVSAFVLEKDGARSVVCAQRGGAMAANEAVHRTILVFDIEQSNHPMRTNRDRVVIHEAMYAAVRTALKRVKYYHEDRGDGVLVLVPPDVPKGRLVSNLLARLEAALGMHNAAMERQN